MVASGKRKTLFLCCWIINPELFYSYLYADDPQNYTATISSILKVQLSFLRNIPEAKTTLYYYYYYDYML